MNKLLIGLKCWWSRWNLIDRIYLCLAFILALAAVFWLFGCSSERMKAEADSLRWSVETGKGDTNGSVPGGSSGYMASSGDASLDTTWISVGLSGDLFPHARHDDTERRYEAFRAMEGLERRLHALEAKPEPVKPIDLPPVKHEEPPPPEVPSEKILGMSPGVFASVLTTLVVGVIGVLQRKRIGKLIQRQKHAT